MKNNIIEVARFGSSTDAHIMASMLGDEGIPVEIFDEHFSSLDPISGAIAGGVKLCIYESDIERAKPIIDRYYENLRIENGDVCPECGSTDIERDYGRQFKAFGLALVGFFMGTGMQKDTPRFMKCNKCGYDW